MEAVNGVSDGGGPPPPSPLTGCYLLIVIGEPHSQEHKDIILGRVAKGLLSWDLSDCMVDLEKELAIITEQAPEGEEARYGERLIQYASENLVTEILIHPAVSTLSQCVRNLLSSFTRHRHIIHSGYTFASNGSWALQDGTFSLADFSEAFQELEVQRVIRAYDNGISVDIHCSPEGEWARLPKESFAKNCKVRLNPIDVLPSSSPAIADFLNYVTPFLVPLDIITALESSEVVGNIRFSHPTLYVFPGGQGDAALFGINGFNMLLDGGFSRKACFWDFVRHLDRLDAVLLTRLNNSNVSGITSVLKRKRQNAVYPQIGHFFCNIKERKALLSPDGDKDRDPLLINLLDEGHDIVTNLRHLNMHPQTCYRDSEPINLYHKVGHGTLDMYVLSPAKDSREVREFIQKWNSNDSRLFANPKTKDFSFPLPNLVSICALLVWQPSNSSENITRILFPGSTPQSKIFEGLDRLKQLDCIKYPVCSDSTLNPPKKTKEQIFDSARMSQKILPEVKKEKSPRLNDLKPKEPKEQPPKQQDNKSSETQETKKEIKKSDSTDSDKSAAKPINKIDNKPIREAKDTTTRTPRVRDKESKSIERKPAPISKIDKKASPTTPKKSMANGDATKPKAKLSPTSTPAKSAKEATNRKVLESKKQTPRKETKAPAAEKKEPEKKVERKPISRRPKPAAAAAAAAAAPATKAATGSPIRKKPDSIAKKAKLDKEGTTDSSTVSTPTADADVKRDISKMTPDEIDQLKAEELADLQEEQEVVQEIEAVFRKGEELEASESEMRQIKNISIEEKTDEEYLVVEKVVIQEDEIQKLTRDSEESEKQRKLSEPKVEEVVKDIVSPEEKVDKVESATQPDEKFSATVESGATTAPTLPEDERIPLDEIKEKDDTQIIEEKHVKEETKEKESIPIIQLPSKSIDTPPVNKAPPVVGIRLDKQQHIRDIVKTPDEVADLPVHEVADHYVEYQKTTDEQPTMIVKEELQDAKPDVQKVVVPEVSDEAKAVVDEVIDESKDIVDTDKEHIKDDVDVVEEAIESGVKDDIKEDATGIVEESKKAVEETISEVQKTADDFSHEVKEDVVEIKETVDETVDEIKDVVEEEGEEKIDEIKEVAQELDEKVKVVKDEIDEGKKAVEDLVCDIKKTSVELSHEVDEVVEEKKQIVETTVETLKESVEETKEQVETTVEESKEHVETTVEETKEHVETTVEETETIVTKKIEEVKESVTEKIEEAKTTIEETKQVVTEKLEEVTTTLSEKVEMAHETIEDTKVTVSETIEDVKTTIEDTKETVAEKVEEVKHTIVEKVEEVKESVEEIKETVTHKIEDAKTTVEVVKESVTGKVEEAKEVVKEVTESAQAIVSEKIEELKSKVEETKEEKVQEVKEELEFVKEHIEDVKSKVEEVKEEAVQELKEELEVVKEKIEEVKEEKVQELKEVKEKIEETVTEKLETAKATVEETKEIVAEKVEDTKELLTSKINEVTEASASIIDEVKATKDEAQESVKEIISGTITEGAKHVEEVQKTVEETTKETISNLEQSGEQIKSAIKDEAQTTVDAIKESINESVASAEATKAVVQETVTKSTSEIKERTEELISKTKSEAGRVVDEISDTKESIVSEVKETVEDLKDVVAEKTQSIGGFFTKSFDKLAETTKAIGEKLSEEVGKVIGDVDRKVEEIKEKGDKEKDEDTTESAVGTSIVVESVDAGSMEQESPESPCATPFEFFDKADLGRKSPKEREQDVAKIVASVAEVLKSEAPLEEFKGKIPLEITTFPTFTPYTTELRETHITTVDSPTTDMPGQISPIKEEKIDEILEEMQDDIDSNSNKSKISDLIKHSNDLLEASSKMISGIKERKDDEDKLEDIDEEEKDDKVNTGVVHRMLVTASSEDGGEETVICPPGSITFSKSSESSGRSSPVDVRKEDLKPETPSPESSQDAPSVLHKEPEISAKMLSEDIPEKKDKVDEDVRKPEPHDQYHDNKELEEHLETEKVASGKSTPDIQKSGKVTPDAAGKTSSAASGKSTPDLHRDDQHSSGKATPDNKLFDAVKEELPSGKSTPDICKSGKSTPDIPSSDAQKGKALSGKSTPDIKDTDSKLASGKATPEPADIGTGKSSPDVCSKSPRLSTTLDEKPLSGKSTPDLKEEAHKLPSGKATPEPSKVLSGKSTPDMGANGKISPETGIVNNEPTTISSIDSGKASPETGIFTTLDTIKTEATSITSTTTSTTASHTEERKESIASATTLTSHEVISGKSTPDLPKSGKESPMVCCRRPESSSGKDSPDHLVDGLGSGRTTPEVNNISGKSTPGVLSGKSTPDIPKSPASATKEIKRESLQLEKSPILSGKVTPDVSKTDIQSGKSSPDFGKGDSIKLDTDSLASGKATPDVNAELAPPSVGHMDTDSLASGKVTPELKHDLSSGKATPDVDKHSTQMETDSLASGKMTPDMHKFDMPSGKSTPDVGKRDSLAAEDKPVLSGKSTPDIPTSKKSSVQIDDKLDVHVEQLSGKSTPSDLQKDGSRKSSIQSHDDKLLAKTPEPDVLSGKSTPDMKKDGLHIDDKIPSGKSTPDVHKEQELPTSKKSSIQIDDDIPMGKSPSPDVSKRDSIVVDDKAASGKSTPDLHKDELASSKKSSIQIDEAIVLSGKITPELKDTGMSSGKATPTPTSETTIDRKNSIKIDDVKSGKTTPDIHEKEELLSSRKESITMSGKATPEPPQSGKTTPDKVDVSNERKDSLHISDAKRDSVASGKTTPEPLNDIAERKASIHVDGVLSGKSSPDHKDDDVIIRKGSIQVEDKLPSGKSTPDLSHKDITSNKLDGKELKEESDKVSSGKATPENGMKDQIKIDGVSSGKSTPDLHQTDMKRDSVSKDVHEPMEKVPSGKSTPDVHVSAKRDSIHIDDKVSVTSGKSTPDIGKLETMTIEEVESGKSTHDVQKEEKLTYDSSKPESVQISSGKSTPDQLKHDSRSGKSTPLSPDHHNGLSRDSIPSGKSTPGLSGKVTPEPDISSGKATPDLKHDTKIVSGKTTDAKQQQEVKVLSGKSTPDSGLNGTSITTTAATTVQSSSVVETLKQEIKSETTRSGSQSPDFAKRGSIQAEHILSGKSTPDSTKITHHQEEHHSGKSTPDFAKRSSIQSEHMLSGKSTPDFVKSDVSLSGKATPDMVKRGSMPISGQSTPKTGKTSPDVQLSEGQGKHTETVSSVTTTTSSFDVTQLQSAHVFRELMEETITSSFDEKKSLNGDVIHEKHENTKLDTLKETSSGKSTPDVAKDSRKSSVMSAADESDYRKFSITSENTKTSSMLSGKSTPDIKDEHEKHSIQAFIDAERQIDSTPSPAKSGHKTPEDKPVASGFPQPDPMSTSFYGALPVDDDDVDEEEHVLHHRGAAGHDLMASSFMGELPSDEKAEEVVKSWGKPLGLPSPAPPSDNKGTPKKERRLPANVSVKNKLNQRSESPSKKKKMNPIYVDLTYVPHHGNSYYSQVDFFKRVRARYYVFSGIEPSKDVYNALLEAKQTWEDKDLEVTIIPTYDTDVLGYWVAENEELLTKYKIDLSPSASRCTINLQDHETSCSAYRLEF